MEGLQEARVRSFDGTDLSYHYGGREDGPTVVLANGLGGPLTSYRHIIRQLRDNYRLVTWDYRGLYRSKAPADPRAVSVDHHVRDLEWLLKHVGVENAVFIGWSMGVQVCFEYYRRHADQVTGLAMLCGVAGSPFVSIPGGAMVGSLMPHIMNVGKVGAGPIESMARTITQWRGLVPIMQRAGLVARSLDMDIFRDISREFASLDVALYCETLKQLGTHSAFDVLPRVSVPTLLVAGDKDVMTPKSVSHRMQQEIPDCRLVVVPGGTHYTPVEFPNEVGDALDWLLTRVESAQNSDSPPAI